jgi:hypothetical protein
MKDNFYKNICRFNSRWMLLLALIATAPAFAQDTAAATTETPATEAVAPEGPELISPLFEFSSVQLGNNTINLKTTLKAKIDGTLTKLQGQTIAFFTTSGESEQKLGEVKTDRNGIAILNVKAEGLVPDAEGKVQFKVSFSGNKTMEAAEEVLGIKRAKLVMVPVKEDSVLNLQFTLVDLSTGAEVPVPEAAIAVYVKRLFNPLKVGEGATDEAGSAVITIPNELPGDAKGMLTLMGRVEDNEVYGNLEAVEVQNWGVPVSDKLGHFPRALWSPDPPIWMLVTFLILMTIVWGHYFVIIYELFRLKGEH